MKISVVLTSYNHEKYIEQAIESILRQKINCALEIVVGDDCSTDKTPIIIEKYKEKHPDTFIILRDSSNLGLTKNLQRCFRACSGDYVAVCEGDDYWIDDNKLALQLEFLESSRNCSMCFNKVRTLYNNQFGIYAGQNDLSDKEFSIHDLIGFNFIGNFSACFYRKKAVDKINPRIYDYLTYDWFFNMAVAEEGNIGYIDREMSVYRVHEGGLWSKVSYEDQLMLIIKNIDQYNLFFESKYEKDFLGQKNKLYLLLFKNSIKDKRAGKTISYGAKFFGGRVRFMLK
ncbi:glycosyltransferase [Leptonema illini]|nr:glycosyltransferase [Leptonema illini]